MHAGASTGEIRREIARVRAWLAESEPEPWVVTSSGSTGAPKRVRLSGEAVDASVELSAKRVGETGQWLLALPPGYVAGFNVITRSLAAGFEPVVLAEHASLADAAAAFATDRRFLSMVPTQLLRHLERDEDIIALSTFHTLLIGGGPVDPSLRERTAALGIRVVATYGSAETCGGVVYDGLPLDGVEARIGEGGRVELRGPTLAEGVAGTDGWFAMSDAGEIGTDGRLRVLGRLDDMVVSGGLNIPGGVVAARLREHPAVVHAEVLGIPDPEWGNVLVAFVTLGAPGASASGIGADRFTLPTPQEAARADPAAEPPAALDALREWVAEAHPRAWAPKRAIVLDAFPTLPNGKVDRLALRERALED